MRRLTRVKAERQMLPRPTLLMIRLGFMRRLLSLKTTARIIRRMWTLQGRLLAMTAPRKSSPKMLRSDVFVFLKLQTLSSILYFDLAQSGILFA
ncbi:hypothetical protein DY000_02059907 [Brassica cretica]|uniref:Uncharacterized protein n=1 Tax=Brassica cretica TaxID=69181 RepID=A0ABQ7B2F9_BRACR|nr:hypothetical protein DY000_02059907 [Brassica cretica]